MKKTAVFLLTALCATLVSAVALAADGDATVTALNTVSAIATVAGIGMAIAILGPSISQGLAIFASTAGIARNPEAAGTIRVTMIIGLALIESLAIYALVIELLILYAFPYSDLITKFLS
ncbi:MAG: ATP synthase F0 subunit C [Deltaproteobacteria bacterium]|jgi:F-type H+-transporting ATPase subunit c|nr:ATP synthase F0 subunit C [Deltaproteobacteria bacterium]